MDKLTFKNYPASILTSLLCFIVALNFGYHVLWETVWEHKTIALWKELLIIILSNSLVLTVLSLINKYCINKWLFKILGLGYIKGNYTGKMISSYHIDDDPTKDHIVRFCKIKIIQNINAFKIEGEIYSDDAYNERTSHFTSSWEEIRKRYDGNFEIRYFFSNKGRQLHPDNQKYGLTNHDGVAVLTFDPLSHKMEGYYFNHERFSNGEIFLELQK